MADYHDQIINDLQDEIERLRICGDALAAWVGIHLETPRRNGKKGMREALKAWQEARRG